MHTIKVAFFKGSGRIRDRFIRWFTRSKFSHVELVTPDGGWIGIFPPDSPRVRKDFPAKVSHLDWEVININISSEQLLIINNFYKKTMSQKYDWIGMIISNILPYRVKHVERWYCSEWVGYALASSGIIPWKYILNFSRKELSPGDLYLILKDIENNNTVYTEEGAWRAL